MVFLSFVSSDPLPLSRAQEVLLPVFGISMSVWIPHKYAIKLVFLLSVFLMSIWLLGHLRSKEIFPPQHSLNSGIQNSEMALMLEMLKGILDFICGLNSNPWLAAPPFMIVSNYKNSSTAPLVNE